jgi:hypothetical protein
MAEIPRGPDVCPITGRAFFMNLEHPELGLVATYGGPFDSYTIPSWDKEDEGVMRCERYDHDAGIWVEGGEPLPFHVVTNDEYVDLWERARKPNCDGPGCEHCGAIYEINPKCPACNGIERDA